MVACIGGRGGAGASRGGTNLGGAPRYSGTGGSVSGGLGTLYDQLRTIVHREVSRMPDTPETAELETLIRALICKADVCLQQQIDDVRRHLKQQIDDVRRRAECEQSHDQDALAAAS
jgi:hypothetical protein